MGLLSGILGAVAGPVISGIFGSKSQDKQNEQNVENTLLQLPRLKQSALDAGFNPLTALQANGGSSFVAQSAAAPLASMQAISNAVTGVADVLTSEGAKKETAEKAAKTFERVETQKKQKGGAERVVFRTRNSPLPSQPKPKVTQTMAAPVGAPTLGADPLIASPVSTTDTVTSGEKTPVNEVMVTGNGEEIITPVGVDGDEWLSGVVINQAGKIKKFGKEAMVLGVPEALKRDVKRTGAPINATIDEWFEQPFRKAAREKRKAKKEEKRKKMKEERANPRIKFPSYLPSITD